MTIDNDAQHQVRSSDRSGTLAPEWDPPEVFDFKLTDPSTQTLEVQVWNRVFILSDSLIGSVVIPLKDFKVDETTPASAYELRSKWGRAAGSVFLQISVKALDEVLIELWENEWCSLTGWTGEEFDLLHHRLHWSNEDGSVSHKEFVQVAPKPPPHFFCHGGWNFVATKDDVNGWLYATTFAGPWYPEASATTVVRRRKWMSSCRPDSTKTLLAF